MGPKAKDKGTKYSLVHRSLLDGAYAGETVPSDFVIVPAKPNANEARRQRKDYVNGIKSSGGNEGGLFDSLLENQSKQSRNGAGGAKVMNHINELGLPNDGYDYSQHLRSMGQGKFIGADGQERSLEYTKSNKFLELPPEALPNEKELERGLETVTIDDRVMDSDLRAALFDDAGTYLRPILPCSYSYLATLSLLL